MSLDKLQFQFQVTVSEVAKVHLLDGFLIAQPTLTHVVKSIFAKNFGADWLVQFKSYLGRSLQVHAVDDGRAFDM
jgi:hypothetical protein